MHPMTLYDIAVREHENATAQRMREHTLALRRRAQDDLREQVPARAATARVPRSTGANRTSTDRITASATGDARAASNGCPAAA